MNNQSLLTNDEEKDVTEMVLILKAISKADREVLMSNARAFKARQEIVNSDKEAS